MKMRILGITLFVFSLWLPASAQKVVEGSFPTLNNGEKLNLVLDFSNANIHGMSEEEFAVYEPDWNVDKPDIIARFFGEMSSKLRGKIYVGNFKEVTYVLKVNVLNITVKGDFECEAILQTHDGNLMARIGDIKAKGGTFGTKLNLIKDGSGHTGKVLGKFIYNHLK